MQDELWVFGYGSLIWDPGFEVAERQVARLDGWHRSFCMWSVHYRGTAVNPGLVLALDARAGATCKGVALRAAPEKAAAVVAYLRDRELISDAYLEQPVLITLANGCVVPAVTYVINRDNPQYCRDLSLEQQARVIATAQGARGPNRDYLTATYSHLMEMGIEDPDMAWLVARLTQM